MFFHTIVEGIYAFMYSRTKRASRRFSNHQPLTSLESLVMTKAALPLRLPNRLATSPMPSFASPVLLPFDTVALIVIDRASTGL